MNIAEVKASIKALKPNDVDWCKWTDAQKRVENLIDGDAIKPIEELETLFNKYTEKKAKAPSKREKKQSVDTIIETIKAINTIDDIEKLEDAIKQKREALENANKLAKEQALIIALEDAMKYNVSLQQILEKHNINL